MGFIIIGVLLFLWEVSQPGFFIAVPASVLVVLGFVGLITRINLASGWTALIVILVAAPTTLGTIHVYRKMAPPQDAPNTTTGESLVGKQGKVTVDVVQDITSGKVRIEGQIWSARSETDPIIPAGTAIEVVRSQGVHVIVARLETS